MALNRRIETWQYYSGISIALIGILHILSVFPVFNTGFESLVQERLLSAIFMFFSTGAAVTFTGCLIVYCSNGMATLENRAWYALMACGGFLLLIGAGAVVVLPGYLFSWLILVAALVQVLPFFLYGKYFQIHNQDMTYVHASAVLKEELKNADHIDIKHYHGKKDLQQFVAALLSYSPWWLFLLYKIRKVFVQCLGMTQESLSMPARFEPGDISMEPGKTVGFFRVEKAKKDTFWIAAAEDRHLKGLIGVVMEKTGAGTNLYHLVTIVHYKDWSGPVYFNVIRPFHHLVVHAMALHGSRG